MYSGKLLFLNFLSIQISVFVFCQKQPHIIFILADDLGWNDVSWQNPSILTPNMESLAREGVILNQSYVQPTCTPSRVALMTGYYPFRVGRQNHVIHPLTPTGVSLSFTFLPELLKESGYSTHFIGKWHLGYCNWSYTPTYRGFDTFFGFYNGALDYFSRSRSANQRGPNAKWNEADKDVGFDLRNNTRISKKFKHVYSPVMFAKVTEDLLKSRSSEEPLFLFLSFQSVHAPLQVPKEYEDLYKHIKDEKRRKYSGMVTAMDDVIGSVVTSLKVLGYWENCLLIFTTDNGGQVLAGGNNWPLRGNKGTLWEGGTRAVTFVHGSALKKTRYVNDKLFHAVDWFPTLLQVGGAKPVLGTDGIDQWKVISENEDAVRDEIVYNIYDLSSPKAAIRVGDFKLIHGFPGKPADWIAPAERADDESSNCAVKMNDSEVFRLYDLKNDPTEHNNLANQYPELVEFLKLKLDELAKQALHADDPPLDRRGDPSLWNGYFSPGWCTAK